MDSLETIEAVTTDKYAAPKNWVAAFEQLFWEETEATCQRYP